MVFFAKSRLLKRLARVNMRILILITGLELGGAETQVSQICDQLVSEGHEICLIAMMGKIDVRPMSEYVKIYSLDMRKNIVSIIKSFASVFKLLDEFHPDIIHSHLFHANIFSRIIKMFKRDIILVNTEHSKYIGSKLRKALYQLTRSIPNFTTNVSNEALENFVNNKVFNKKNSVAIYNGINVNKFSFSTDARMRVRAELSIPEHRKIVLAIGRLVAAKDYPNLLNSFSLLNTENVDLLIIGAGSELEALQSLIEELNLIDKVKLLGAKQNVEDYLSACDIFVLSSAWEGFGLVVAEAMSCERIVVATDAGGVKEVVGDYGFIVPIKSPYELANKVAHALSLNQDEASMLQKNARHRIENTFSLNHVCHEWLWLYRKLLCNER